MKALCYFGYNIDSNGKLYIFQAEPTVKGKYKYFSLLAAIDDIEPELVAEIVEMLKASYYAGFNGEDSTIDVIEDLQQWDRYDQVMDIINEAYNCGLVDSEGSDNIKDVAEYLED